MSRPTTDELVLIQWDSLVELTSGLGHRLNDPDQDTDVSLVAECSQCDEVFAVDGQERPYLFGPLNVPCKVSHPVVR